VEAIDIESIQPIIISGSNEHDGFDNSNPEKFSAANIVGATVSATATARMKTYAVGNINVPQQTRHARRIYVGGIPPNWIDEDALRNFINSVIAQGLGEPNDHSYVLSVYINQKKCFAFVELKSIELATASLELDGIMLKNIALRVLRANEYKPELVPVSMNNVIHFDLSGFQFGNPLSFNASTDIEESNPHATMDRSFDSLIGSQVISNVEAGSLVLVGYPYDENPRKGILRGMGCANTPKIFRNCLRKYKFGSVDNPEYGIDLSSLKLVDVGDIIGGKVMEDCRNNLLLVTSELLARSSFPMLLGGCHEMIYPAVKATLNTVQGEIAIVTIGSKFDVRILEDMHFMNNASSSNNYNCISSTNIGSFSSSFSSATTAIPVIPAVSLGSLEVISPSDTATVHMNNSNNTNNAIDCGGRLVVFGAQVRFFSS
jgi:hypothetical protein